MEGASKEEQKANAFWVKMTEAEHVQHYVDSGMSKSDAIKAAAKDRGVGKSDIYNIVMKK
jgi:16S rRNA (cytidine1402-2'-O)-methyltransferase